MSIALIVPTYGAYDYALKTVTSFFTHTPGNDNRCYVIDDGHKDWHTVNWANWPVHTLALADTPRQALAHLPNNNTQLLCHRFTDNNGLTRSWNLGLYLAANSPAWRADYVVCGNSDLLFTANWSAPLLEGLNSGLDLIGPVTNAPGHAFWQNVAHYCRYTLTDNPLILNQTAKSLNHHRLRRCVLINGFCMMAKTETWWRGAFSPEFVFNPRYRMTGNEDELQVRWRRDGYRIGFSPRSFVFHYRSVSRPAAFTGYLSKGGYRHESDSGNDNIYPT
jgi:glycosyltransferase involved in cell wall biosynthesis